MKICVSMLRFSDRFPENMANMKTRKGKISKVLLDLYGLTEICSYCSKKWVELHSAKFVWVYYLLLFDLINISLSLSYGVYS